MENEFPPNSHTDKEARPERRPKKGAPEQKVIRRVARGKVTMRKKPLRKKFIDAFRPEDNVGFVEYTLLEVLVPGIKDALADAVHGTIDNAFGTGGRGRRHRRGGGGGYTSYNRMSSARPRSRRDRDDDDDRHPRGHRERRQEQHEAILPSRVEAEETLDQMIEVISTYDAVTVRDLLSMLGEPHEFTDQDWGWEDLRGARIHRIGNGGYLLDLPRPIPLD